ncbi:MAG TPA: UvrB/UvrC motif-containing protein, partial [Spirochaetota bacterium]|nr:UvrB/UvrC motif-containing protein [Spirochaetota bacterium]HQO23917.1 UvrB/UvrC motif-containing protein [Spirochaetota bacterium]
IKNNITPKSISKEIFDIIEREYQSVDAYADVLADYKGKYKTNTISGLKGLRDKIREDMLAAADSLDFEKAALLRDEMNDLNKKIELKEKTR